MLEPFWLSTVPLFLKLREADLYSVFHLKWDLSNLDDKQRILLETYRNNIENKVPYVDFDFTMPGALPQREVQPEDASPASSRP